MIPLDAFAGHSAVLGRTGSGKTYLTKGVAERFLDDNERVCIIDPTSVWWGLKSSATGKKAGYPVVIFGGEHADMPISGAHGEIIAEVVATSKTSTIIDLGSMRTVDRVKFITNFFDELLRRNKGKLRLIIDEAHLFAPQSRVMDPRSSEMLHATNNLVSLGRAKGLCVSLITQRPAKLHKDSLTQVGAMIALQLTAPQDRKAIEDWIADQADMTKGKEIIASLPTLKPGECIVWAPQFGILGQYKSSKITTFDSSRAPEEMPEGKGPILAAINLDELGEKLKGIAAEADANNPAKLRAQIMALTKENENLNKTIAEPVDLQGTFNMGFDTGMKNAFSHMITKLSPLKDTLLTAMDFRFLNDEIERPSVLGLKPVPKLTAALELKKKDLSSGKGVPKLLIAEAYSIKSEPIAGDVAISAPADAFVELTPSQQRIVNSLGFWHESGLAAPSRDQVAAVAGYSPTSGNFGNIAGTMKSSEIIEYPQPGKMSLTNPLLVTETLTKNSARGRIMSILSPTQVKLVEAFGGDVQLSRDELATRTSYSTGSGNYGNIVGSLCKLRFFSKPSPGMIELVSWVREII